MKTSLIKPYKTSWLNDFTKIKNALNVTLEFLDTSIEHIGSTSVPNLAAKGIIDIDISYTDNVSFEVIKERLMKSGYFHNGNQGINGREVFKRSNGIEKNNDLDSITHHLYVCHYKNEELKRHLLFRDYLRTNTTVREKYEMLKYRIAREANENKKAYAALKEIQATDFINQVLKQASKG